MAAAATTLTTATNIAKEIYQGKIRDQLQNEAVGYKRIEQTSEGVTSEVGGKYVTFPIRVKRNSGIGYRNESEALPSADSQKWLSVRIGLKYGYGRLQLTGQTFSLLDKNFQAFASVMDAEMNGLKGDIAKDVSRIFYGDSTGTLATAVAGTGATGNVVTVDNIQYLEIGMIVDYLTSAGASKSTNARSITAITPGTYPGGTVTVEGAAFAGGAAGDIVVRTGNYGREPNGLRSIVKSSGALFNVNPATAGEEKWAAVVDSNSGTNRALSEGLMIKNTDNVRINGGKTSLILYSLGVRRAYFNLLTQQRRYPSTTKFEGGLSGLAFSNGRDIPCVEDVDCPANTMFGLDEDTFKIYRDEAWSWMDRDGNVWKQVAGFDAYEAILYQYWELGTSQRNANFRISDVTEG